MESRDGMQGSVELRKDQGFGWGWGSGGMDIVSRSRKT